MSEQKTELNKEYIKSKLQKILDKTHTEPEKKKIVPFSDRFNCACPICGDSSKWNGRHKKRGNFYFKNAKYVCFNCDTRISFTELCDNFNEKIDLNEKINLYKYIDENISFTNNNNDYIMEEMDKLIDVDDFMEYFNNRKNSWLVDIKIVEPNSHVGQYLYLERYIPKTKMILQGVYRVFKEGKNVFETRVMISLNMSLSMNKILGIQLRNLVDDKSKRFYKIVEFEELYNYMHPEEPLDEQEAIAYNKLSHMYNILNVDFEKVVSVFEGFIDSLFFPNSIGLIGANSTNDVLSLLEASEDIILRFFYDNDAAGISIATKMLKDGYGVFLWNKLFLKLQKKNKQKAQFYLKNIIDLNDLVRISKNQNISQKLKLDEFFSIDDFDLMYLDKVSYTRDDNGVFTSHVKRLL